MTLVKKLIHPLPLLYLIILLQIGYFLALSTRPYRIAPPGRTYNVLGKNFYYPSWIRLGKDGNWGLIDTHNTRFSPKIYAHLYFVFLGRLAAIFSVDPVTVYQIARVSAPAISTIAVYFFASLFLPKWFALLATAATNLIEPGPSFQSLLTGKLSQLVPAWDVHILYERRFMLPHHVDGEALGIILFGLLIFFTIHPPKKASHVRLLIIGCFLLSFVATAILPSYLVIFTGILLPILFLISVKTRSLRTFLTFAIPTLVGIAIQSFIIKHEFSKGAPWIQQSPAEKSFMTHDTVITQYLGTLIPFYPAITLTLVATIIRWKKLSTPLKCMTVIAMAWLIVPASLVLVSNYPFFPVANFRLVDLHGYFPAGLLAALALYHVTKGISKRTLRYIIVSSILVIFFGSSLILSLLYTKQIMAKQEGSWLDTYPPKAAWEGVLFMEKLPKGSKVMVRESYGEMLPAFGPISAFIGGAHAWPDWVERREITHAFYLGTLPEIEAKRILTQEHIDYVFWGPDEKGYAQTPTLYPSLLTPIFSNSDVTIFQTHL